MLTKEHEEQVDSSVPTVLGNPPKDAGFQHFPSHECGGPRLPTKIKPAKIAGLVGFLRSAEKESGTAT